jgi:hypothetical protein
MKVLLTIVMGVGDISGVESVVDSRIIETDSNNLASDICKQAQGMLIGYLNTQVQNNVRDIWKIRSVCHSILPS